MTVEIISRQENLQFQPARGLWTHNGDFVFKIVTPYFRGRFSVGPGTVTTKRLKRPERIRAEIFRAAMKAEFRSGFSGVSRKFVDDEYFAILAMDGLPKWKIRIEKALLFSLGAVTMGRKYWRYDHAVEKGQV